MRIAFSTIACPAYGPEQMADAARAHGYDGVELYAADGGTLPPDLLASQLERFQHALRGVPIVCINSFATLGALAPEERVASEVAVLQALELAAALECPLVKAFGGEIPPGTARESVVRAAAAMISSVAPAAARLGVTLVVETHDGFCRGTELAELLTLAGSGSARALWDVHHPVRMGEAVAVTDAAIGSDVAHVHVKDAVREDGAWRFSALGKGDLPVANMLECLAARGFAGAVSVDYEKLWRPELEEPEQSLPQHAIALRAAIDAATRHGRTTP